MEPLNRLALEFVDEALDFADELRIGATELDNGATVLDFGVDHRGGLEAGLLLAELQTAGLASVGTRMGWVAGAARPHVELNVDHPALALLCSGKAGWELSVDGEEALGAGPARALVAEEPEFRALGYSEAAEFAVLALESARLPGEAAAAAVAERAGVDTESVFLPTYPAASLAGSVVAAARAAELAAFRLFELGYGIRDLVSASGSAPVAPVAADERTAVARTTDALAYGGAAHLVVGADFDRFDEAASTAGEVYGRPLAAALADEDGPFPAGPSEVYAPAAVTVDVLGGPTYAAGERDESVLAESFAL